MATSAKSMSQVSQAAVSYLAVRDASAAIEFYKKAFGAIETLRLTDPSGKIAHAEISIGNSSIYLAEEMPGWQNPSPDTLGGSAVTIVLNVADVDSVVRQAVEAMLSLGAHEPDISVLLGPAVSGRNYEVPAAMADEVEAALPGSRTTTSRGTPGLDLRAGIACQLKALGVSAIDIDPRCTVEDVNLFSHRRGAPTGRLASVVWME